MKKTTLAVSLVLSGAFVASTLIAPTASAQSSLFGSSRPSNSTPSTPSTPATKPAAVSDGLDVTMIGDLISPQQTGKLGLLSGDLGVMAPVGVGKEFAIIFGDSFRGSFGQGEWMSPVGVVAEKDANGKIIVKRPLNKGDRVEQLVKYQHTSDGLTLLPSDIINIDGTLYMQAMWNQPLGTVLRTQIYKSTDNGQSWQTVTTIPANFLGGSGQLISWEKGPDGYIYMVSSKFGRVDDVFLTRFKPENIGDRSKWEHLSFNGNQPVWGTKYSPILKDKVTAGEMSLRYIEGHWVLVMFNEETWSIETRIADDIARDWNSVKKADVVVAGRGGWGAKQGPNNFSQLYGGYIVPGSTIANMDLVVSQWNTSNNSRYNSTQFNVKGLDKFFGIVESNTRFRSAPAVGDQSVVTATETPILDVTAQDQLPFEAQLENAADIMIVPMEQ